MKTVNTIQEAVEEILRQLDDKDFFMHNYTLLNNIEDYLYKCVDENDSDFDKEEQIFNYVAYDLKWEDREEELFPMEL